jgi:hypothetical protein
MLGNSAVHAIECGRDDVNAQHHPRPTTIGLVVDLASAERCGVSVVEDPEVERGSEHRSYWTTLLYPCKGARDQGEDIEAHGAEP